MSDRRPADSADHLAGMRDQVYKDPRPAEHFDRFHERAETSKARLGVPGGPGPHDALRIDRISGPRGGIGEGAPRGAADPRTQSLLVDGPLPRRHVPSAPGPVHGQVPALQAADAVRLHARRSVPGAARARRPGRVHHGGDDPRPGWLRRHVLRGRALANRRARRARQAGHRQARAAVGRRGHPGRDLRLTQRVRNWKRLGFPRVTVHYGEPMAFEQDAGSIRDRQQAVADEIFAEIKCLYAAVEDPSSDLRARFGRSAASTLRRPDGSRDYRTDGASSGARLDGRLRQRRQPADQVRGPLGDRDRRRVRVPARDGRHDRGVDDP